MADTTHHSQKFCSIKKQTIPRGSQTYAAACPFCGVPLPAKNRYVIVTFDNEGNVLSYEDVPPSPWWQRTPGVVLAVVLVVIGWVVFGALDLTGEQSGSSSVSSVKVTSASSEVNGKLLGGDAYIGSGSYTSQFSRKAYSSQLDATAIASRVSVPGESKLCLFWYVGGTSVDSGLTIGDTVTRQFSVWGTDVTAGSQADGWVRELKRSPEGKATRSAVGC